MHTPSHILKFQEVNYCNVVRQLKNKKVVIPGIIYQDNLYVQIDSFAKEERNKASWRSWALKAKNIANLIVEERGTYTIWSLDNNVKIANDSNLRINFAYTLNLRKLVAQMRSEDGVEIKDRWYRLKLYSQCFVSSEAIVWLREFFQISTDEAIDIGQRLIEEDWLHHVCDDHNFRDGYFFYRFYLDE